jgi:prepilin-type N-terminal cleavage/methylation domain-containing protein
MFNLKRNNNLGFTLIELLIVIAIIGLLATLSVVVFAETRIRSRDANRLSDINRLQKALHLYWQASGLYPSELNPGESIDYSGITFMAAVPFPPEPTNDGNCDELTGEDLKYTYTTIGTGGSMKYELEFCLGRSSGGLSAGDYIASPEGIRPAP